MTTEMISTRDRIQSRLQPKTSKVQSQRCIQRGTAVTFPQNTANITGAHLPALRSQLFLGETPSKFCNRKP